MQKWEYCEIIEGELVYFTAAGEQSTEFHWKERPRIFAQLGEEGWEMCAIDAFGLYFKRPKP